MTQPLNRAHTHDVSLFPSVASRLWCPLRSSVLFRHCQRFCILYVEEADVVGLPERECPICRDDFTTGDKVVKMPCSHSHIFHKSCVAEWLERDDSCPMCRSSLPVWLGRPQYA